MRIFELIDEGYNNILIVAPKSALGAWERDVEKFRVEDQTKFNFFRNTDQLR